MKWLCINYICKCKKFLDCILFQYSGWQLSNKDNYIAVQVSFKVQSRQETIVELHFDPTQQQEVVKYVIVFKLFMLQELIKLILINFFVNFRDEKED